ncbi:MAG TPA: DoxX family protein [Phycisphaerae bacterium]|nr:DoxX family protein [Phycisphaerae bacterium]HRY67105.1 DoxX family protein [Phycisphaerae bacterium]HSA26526.1 DoxX family protein [Phycisphaerae bacterium]
MDNRPGLLRRLDQTGVPLLIARLILGGVFVYNGAVKASHPFDFMKMVREYHMVPDHPAIFLNLIGSALPWLEIWCGLLLILGLAMRGSALLILTMLVGFTIAVTVRALNIYFTEGKAFCEIYFDCGCGTGIEWICGKIPKNLGMCILSLVILFSRSRRFCLDAVIRPPGATDSGVEVAPAVR